MMFSRSALFPKEANDSCGQPIRSNCLLPLEELQSRHVSPACSYVASHYTIIDMASNRWFHDIKSKG
jgi:hypothetical protein